MLAHTVRRPLLTLPLSCRASNLVLRVNREQLLVRKDGNMTLRPEFSATFILTFRDGGSRPASLARRCRVLL